MCSAGLEIAVLEPLHPEAMAVLAACGALRQGLDAPLRGAAAVVTRGAGRVTADRLAAAGPDLRCVARVGAGTDNVDVEAASALGLPVFYAPEAFAAATAEHALALLLAVMRRVGPLDAAVRGGRWDAREAPGTVGLHDLRCGIVGLGRIGRRFAALASACGMEVAAWSRRSRDDRIPHMELTALLRWADVVSLHVSLEPETVGLLSRERIAAMKPGAVLINVARGSLVDELALAAALRAGRLKAAALDVLSVEPPPPDHPLVGLPNAVLTPHVGALTAGAFRRASVEVAQAVAAFLREGEVALQALRNPTVLQALRTKAAPRGAP